ncbi:MAG: LON peptidase substrate-binding domain-containing protein [Planctomycetota bacterium]|nr:LON peptidase substrate-binding domain-containing protein [Planctomycetota bacterium]
MTDNQNKTQLPADFTGRVRLFPLPDLVMFPHVMQPLHIFEPRYRELVEDALATDQLVAMAHLQAGWEADYEDRPPIFPVTCIGRIVSHARLDDGKFNILLLGLRRALITDELPLTRSFREAEVAVLEDLYAGAATQERASIQRELLHCFRRFTPESPAAQEQFESLMNNRLPLGVLTDIISFTMKFDVDLKQRLLSEWNVDQRARMLLAELRQLDDSHAISDDERKFPPEFSAN